MATGSGETFTSITAIYRLLKYAKARRVLFLVDTKYLGEQAEQEFMCNYSHPYKNSLLEQHYMIDFHHTTHPLTHI